MFLLNLDRQVSKDFWIMSRLQDKNNFCRVFKFTNNLDYEPLPHDLLDAICQYIEQNRVLNRLILKDFNLSKDQMTRLAQAISNCPTLETFDLLRFSNLRSKLMKVLTTALKDNGSLTTLTIKSFILDDKQISLISDLILANPSIRHLTLQSRTKLDVRSIDLLAKLTTLETLNLSGNRFNSTMIYVLISNTKVQSLDLQRICASDEIMTVLFNTMTKNQTVTTLNVRYNKIESGAIVALERMIRGNTTITSIDLSGCRLGDSGFQLVMISLQSNEVLSRFVSTQNLLSDLSIQYLIAWLQVRKSPLSIDLRGNVFTIFGYQSLQKLMKFNSTVIDLNLTYGRLPQDNLEQISVINRYVQRNKHNLALKQSLLVHTMLDAVS